MITLTDLYAEHWDLMETSENLLRMLARDARPLAHELTAMRWQLMTMIDRHLAHEELVVRRPLERSADSHARFLGQIYADDLLELRLAAAKHSDSWDMNAVRADWEGYRAAVGRQVAALKRRIEWEEREIFPTVAAFDPEGFDIERI